MLEHIDKLTLMVDLGCDGHDNDLLNIAADLAIKLNAAVMGAAAFELATEVCAAYAGIGGLASPQEVFKAEAEHAEARIAEAEAIFLR